MKKLSVMIALIMLTALFVDQARAQLPALTKTVALNKAYANSQTDTSLTIAGMGMYNNVGVVFTAKDSASAKIVLDTRPYGGTTWTAKDSVTILSAVNAGSVTEYQLRGPTVDKIAGATSSIRFRTVWAGSANGTTSATYTSVVYYK